MKLIKGLVIGFQALLIAFAFGMLWVLLTMAQVLMT